MRVRRPEDHKPAVIGEYAVVAIKSFANEQPVILQPLLRTRGAEARDGGIELDLQRRCAHLDGKEKAWTKRWRRERDSNPRYRKRYNRFRVCRIRPLCHLSAGRTASDLDASREFYQAGRSILCRPLR